LAPGKACLDGLASCTATVYPTPRHALRLVLTRACRVVARSGGNRRRASVAPSTNGAPLGGVHKARQDVHEFLLKEAEDWTVNRKPGAEGAVFAALFEAGHQPGDWVAALQLKKDENTLLDFLKETEASLVAKEDGATEAADTEHLVSPTYGNAARI
jgi:hypothetical protein